MTPDYTIPLRLDQFLFSAREAGLRVRSLKLSTAEWRQLRTLMQAKPDLRGSAGGYRGIPIRIVTRPVWTS